MRPALETLLLRPPPPLRDERLALSDQRIRHLRAAFSDTPVLPLSSERMCALRAIYSDLPHGNPMLTNDARSDKISACGAYDCSPRCYWAPHLAHSVEASVQGIDAQFETDNHIERGRDDEYYNFEDQSVLCSVSERSTADEASSIEGATIRIQKALRCSLARKEARERRRVYWIQHYMSLWDWDAALSLAITPQEEMVIERAGEHAAATTLQRLVHLHVSPVLREKRHRRFRLERARSDQRMRAIRMMYTDLQKSATNLITQTRLPIVKTLDYDVAPRSSSAPGLTYSTKELRQGMAMHQASYNRIARGSSYEIIRGTQNNPWDNSDESIRGTQTVPFPGKDKQNADGASTMEAATIRVQKVFRGYAARKEVKDRRRMYLMQHYLSLCDWDAAFSLTLTPQERAVLEKAREHAAATRIQKLVRVHVSRIEQKQRHRQFWMAHAHWDMRMELLREMYSDLPSVITDHDTAGACCD
ncbi:MAG: hypothetical protein SGPRY_013287 [Prymnesium sp.]